MSTVDGQDTDERYIGTFMDKHNPIYVKYDYTGCLIYKLQLHPMIAKSIKTGSRIYAALELKTFPRLTSLGGAVGGWTPLALTIHTVDLSCFDS